MLRGDFEYSMSRVSFVVLALSILILFVVYSYLKSHLTDDARPHSGGTMDNAVAARCMSNQRALRASIAAFKLAHEGRAPANLDLLVPRYLPAVPHCPSGALYQYDAQSGELLCPEGHGG
jgi:hypothetical protein